MISFGRIKKITLSAIFFVVWLTPKVYCSDSGFFDAFNRGTWRFEILGGSGLSSRDKSDRKGDYYFTGSVEYGWPIYKSRTDVGVRVYPAFIYYQDKNDKGEDDIVFAAALGVLMRQYRDINHKGFYWELGISPLWNSHLFRRNAARWNLLSEIDIGYQFDTDWHVALKFQHISNADTRSPNEGVNALALCLGFRF
jgi:hypothetical protein